MAEKLFLRVRDGGGWLSRGRRRVVELVWEGWAALRWPFGVAVLPTGNTREERQSTIHLVKEYRFKRGRGSAEPRRWGRKPVETGQAVDRGGEVMVPRGVGRIRPPREANGRQKHPTDLRRLMQNRVLARRQSRFFS
mgnify:CR=1 FL=1